MARDDVREGRSARWKLNIAATVPPHGTSYDGPGFDARQVREEIRDFYERTSAWRMEVRVGWSPVFWPAGEAVSRLFGRRLDQLALPTRPLDVARGMDSSIALLVDGEGVQQAAPLRR